MLKVDWRKYADKVYALSYVSNSMNREILAKEFDRVGIDGYEIRYYTINKLFNHLDNSYVVANINEKDINITNAHYETIKEAYGLGYESIIVFEDNVLFLKDIGKIYDELESIAKNDDDISIFDCISYDTSKIENYNGYMHQFISAYRLNRIGMEYMIMRIEHMLIPFDYYFTNCDRMILDPQTNEMLEYVQYYNPMDREIKVGTYNDERICIQYNFYGKARFIESLYDVGSYSNYICNENRIDKSITEIEAIRKYNFDEYRG